MASRKKQSKARQTPQGSQSAEKQESTAPQQDEVEPEPLFFYMPDADFGEFCQWYPSEFTLYSEEISDLVGHTIGDPSTEITLNCAEQFMMFCKAARFHDTSRQAVIMATKSPKEQKRLGKLTVGFTDHIWDEIKSQVVEAGNMAKFGQNIHLQRKLLSTGDRLLCEAASRDRVWGIGYTAKHAMSHRKHWGENRLGQALMAVRGRLRAMEDEANVYRSWDRAKVADKGKS